MEAYSSSCETPEVSSLALHDALPISRTSRAGRQPFLPESGASAWRSRSCRGSPRDRQAIAEPKRSRTEEHTSELQSRQYLVCRLLRGKKDSLNDDCGCG